MPGITSTSTYYSTPYTGTGFHVEVSYIENKHEIISILQYIQSILNYFV